MGFRDRRLDVPTWVSVVGVVVPGYLSFEGCRVFFDSHRSRFNRSHDFEWEITP